MYVGNEAEGLDVDSWPGNSLTKKRLPSPLPKPSAHGFAYDATSRRIELEREHVRLRQRQTHGG